MSDSTTTSREYEVLYFKRKNKVHKSKGVSKMDGKLVLDTVKNCIKLYDEGEKKPIHSSINSEIANRAFGADEEFSLAQYEVQIVIELQSNPAKIPSSKKPVTSRQPLRTLQNNGKKLLSKAKPSSLMRRKPLPTSNTVAAKKPSWLNRRPPAQPKAALSADTEESSDEEEQVAAPIARMPAAMQKKRTPLLGQKRKLVPRGTPTTVSPKQLASLSGAVGTIVLPPSIRSVLRPHQQDGVVFLWNALTRAPEGAILADSMGMGKTLMTIATLFALHRRAKQHRFIIVCPSSLVQNWAKEFDKWLGRASQPKRVVVKKGGEEGLKTIRGFCPIKPNQSEVLIISYDLFRMNAQLLKEAKQIGLLVVDEGHRLKNSSGSITLTALNSLDCEARLLITGTPIQNNLSEFHAMANFCVPGLLGSLQDFRRDYERPISAANRKDASSQQRMVGQAQSQALEEITKTFMLRRLAKDVLKDLLPPRVELLLFCKPSRLQCGMYRTMTERQMSDPLSTLTNLRKLCSHPDLIENNRRDCNASGKMFVLEKLLDEIRKTNDKVVLVSSFTSTLSMIEEKLVKPKQWNFKRLDGTTKQSDRQPLVDSFNRSTADQSFLFLLSSKAGGMGLNLVGANRLVMFDADYNPAIDHQAMARIYRPGQTKPTYIYRFFTSGTMEEVVYQRQTHKDNLSNMTVDKNKTSDAATSKFTAEELRDCFTLKDTACDSKAKMKWGDTDCTDPVVSSVLSKHPDVLSHVHTVPDPVPDAEMQHSEESIDQPRRVSQQKKKAKAAPVVDDSEEESDDVVLAESSSDEEEFEWSD